jgi:Xaa-Pro aminopeptidase
MRMKWIVLGGFVLIASGINFQNSCAQSKEYKGYAQRRQRLMKEMDGGIAIFKSSKVKNRSNDTSFEYRQDSDFYYLTGFDEPSAVFLLMPGQEKKFVMFVQPRNPNTLIWTGERYGIEGAMEKFGADTAFASSDLTKKLQEYLKGKKNVYCNSSDAAFRKNLKQWIKETQGDLPRRRIKHLSQVHQMRLVKEPGEIVSLRKAIDMTCDAHIEAMRMAEPGMFEFEIEAAIEYIFRKNGSPCPGFPSIVGSGPNSTVMHYETSTRKTESGDMLVMDIGAEYEYYSADVTRTMPVNGRFSPEQREIYEIVLKANQEAIALVRPGKGLYDIHKQAMEVLADGLFRLGLITDKERPWQTQIYCMYNTNHWLGLDVHDVGSRGPDDGKGMPLVPGMVFTVEPGIYVGEATLGLARSYARNVPEKEIDAFVAAIRPAVEKYMNIGVRIEDDVLVTETGHENLSVRAPKGIAAIERLMAEKSFLNYSSEK